MCCKQIYVLSDVGLQCSRAEEYFEQCTSFITQITHGERTKSQQVESCLGHYDLQCNIKAKL